MIRKELFILAHELGDISFYSTYKRIMKSQWKPYEELKIEQEKQLRQMIAFCYENVPYYRSLFKSLHLLPKNIATIEDLEKLPILTKDIIKKRWEEFTPFHLSSMNYQNRATGGSTGTPLSYRLSRQDRFLGGAIQYRGWGAGGYGLGDKMLILAGSSLGINSKSKINKKAHEIARNMVKLSSFDMNETEMLRYADILNHFQPKYIRGYASSLHFFATWLENNDISVPSPNAVFTTSEKLFPYMRETISRVFSSEVYDGYSLNDGGVSASECPEHTGLHIDTERSIMEVVDGDGLAVDSGEGQILATSLHNYAMPFIRYATGDETVITEDFCGCGRRSRLLEQIIGRSVDFLITPDGKYIHGWFFLYIFWEYCKGVKEYQVVQKTSKNIEIKMVIEDDFDEEQLDRIREIVAKRSPDWDIEFKHVDAIERTGAGKYKFIINEVSHV